MQLEICIKKDIIPKPHFIDIISDIVIIMYKSTFNILLWAEFGGHTGAGLNVFLVIFQIRLPDKVRFPCLIFCSRLNFRWNIDPGGRERGKTPIKILMVDSCGSQPFYILRTKNFWNFYAMTSYLCFSKMPHLLHLIYDIVNMIFWYEVMY